MDLWIIIAGAVGFTLLTMLMGPWMWSSSWTKWKLYKGKGEAPEPREGGGPRLPPPGAPPPRS